jgi:hypothetical protein
MKSKYYMIDYDNNMSTGLIVKASSKKEAIELYAKNNNMLSMIEECDYKIFRPTFELSQNQANKLIGTVRGGVVVRFFN